MNVQQTDRTERYCVIGAGAAGLTAAKNFLDQGFEVDVIEREDDIGGNWYYGKPNSSIYRSVHMISSKRYSQYPDFPMPERWPTYLNRELALEYLRSYARTFLLYDHITFNTAVEQVSPTADESAWDVTLDTGEVRRYRGVVVANGHLWAPRFPRYPGEFSGTVLHSSEYKEPDLLRGKRVLVVGAGNSGCDIAVESCLHAARTFHSTRRGYTFWPKFMLGQPSDHLYEIVLRLRLPLAVRRMLAHIGQLIFLPENPERYGLQRPKHRMFEEHFLVNSSLLYHLGHGDIIAKPDIQRLDGTTVVFQDGTTEEIDVIVYGTGFHLNVFPFIDRKHLNWKTDKPELYLNIFHPRYNNLFFIGWIQTSAGYWPLMHYQAELAARFAWLNQRDPQAAAFFRKLKAGPSPDLSGGLKYLTAERYAIEVNHFPYRARVRELSAKLKHAGAQAGPARAQTPRLALASGEVAR